MSSPERETAFPIDPIFTGRWSRRAFADAPIPHALLMTLFEAARWAPSARNAQPWHFLYARRDGPDWPLFLDLVYERNRIWAEHSGALVAVLSRHQIVDEGAPKPWRTHAFDTGAAWAQLALQAHRLGLSARAMGGIDLDRARPVLGIPDDFTIQIMIAIGQPGSAETLPAHLRDLEAPNSRRPVADLVTEGRFHP